MERTSCESKSLREMYSKEQEHPSARSHLNARKSNKVSKERTDLNRKKIAEQSSKESLMLKLIGDKVKIHGHEAKASIKETKDRLKTTKPSSKNENIKHGQKSNFLDDEGQVKLRSALLLSPLHIWKFKDRFNSAESLGIHETLLHHVIDNKWNKRLKHKLYKVFRGENVHVSVIGGSNTAGGGIQKDEGTTEGIFFRVILDWWQKVITPITGSHLKMRQIAMGGTGSDFFQYCYKSYVQENVDLIFLEMSVNDLHDLPNQANLSLPPAVLYVNLFSGRSYYQGCASLEDFGQRLLSDVYNITTFSWRDAVCPDGHHINQLGHAHIALMAINLFRDVFLDNLNHMMKLRGLLLDSSNHVSKLLPRPMFIDRENKIIRHPLCWTTLTPNFKRKIIKNSMEVGVMENYGFDYLHNKRIGDGECWTESNCRADAYSGWTGKDVGAILVMSFTIPPLHYKPRTGTRSVVLATRTCWNCGIAESWLDDDIMGRKRLQGHSKYAQTLLQLVGLRVEPGDHTMSVKLVHPGYFTVVGVMLGPPDGPY
ncbi:LOW QUALITY PROTEIN: uncharacterized protein LOC124453448 [Xenia sp. Carnegie-2017]|uniref:LOW QUALITY PROTEIN: uncharacterized protein LOC124453448 n=1 Tax=Xenia sp. Carnegie-2017 TaxID=2897299 RepID=UPI001F045063|nr:LOW QUALITY PROTEIN: uncharacterized protein LOC124453448 [Xenia sp. Carnegie-2017]